MISVTTDRQSGFDRHLASVPFKGQVVNQTSVWWLENTRDIVPNALLSAPHPNVAIMKKCEVFPVEFVVRGYMTGSTSTSIWTNYNKGVRSYCGNDLPDGLVKNDKLEKNIVTPTTKSDVGDAPITPQEIVDKGLMTQAEWNEVRHVASCRAAPRRSSLDSLDLSQESAADTPPGQQQSPLPLQARPGSRSQKRSLARGHQVRVWRRRRRQDPPHRRGKSNNIPPSSLPIFPEILTQDPFATHSHLFRSTRLTPAGTGYRERTRGGTTKVSSPRTSTRSSSASGSRTTATLTRTRTCQPLRTRSSSSSVEDTSRSTRPSRGSLSCRRVPTCLRRMSSWRESSEPCWTE